MKFTTVSVSYARKFNLGDYESLELSCSLWAQMKNKRKMNETQIEKKAQRETERLEQYQHNRGKIHERSSKIVGRYWMVELHLGHLDSGFQRMALI